VDESAAMRVAVGDVVSDGKPSAKTTSERVATCINALLAQFTNGPNFDLAVVGYKTERGQVDVGCRWGGAFAGREFVATSELGTAPLRVENRVRKLPSPDGTLREETGTVPVWYAPSLGETAPQIAAYDYCRELLSRWLAAAGPKPGLPVVAHVYSGAAGDGNPEVAAAKLMALATPAGPVLLLQAHLASSSALVTTAYPSSLAYLTLGAPRDLFRHASVLPAHLVSALKEANIAVNANARGMLHNAKISDLIRFLGLVKAHTRSWPTKTATSAVASAPVGSVQLPSTIEAVAAVAPATSGIEIWNTGDGGSAGAPRLRTGGEKTGLVIFVLDRAVADPVGTNADSPCVRLQDNANDLLKQLSKLKEARVDVATISYGLDANNKTEVRATFDGPLAGKTVVSNTDLLTGALRTEEFEEQVSNGIGGLVSLTRKKPIYYDITPAAAAMPNEAFATARRVAGDWCAEHSNACLPPIVLHLTRGQFDGRVVEEAFGQFHSPSSDLQCLIYHLIVTERPHKSIAYPETDSEIEVASIKLLWEQTSPLLGRERIAVGRPSLAPNARGFVINGKFDLFVESIKDALAIT
jgi:hypothetical protein